MIFAPGGNTQPLNRLTYLQAMNVDAVSQERCGVYVSNHVYLCFQVPSAKHFLKHDYFYAASYCGKSNCQMATWINVFVCNLARILHILAWLCERGKKTLREYDVEWYSVCSEVHLRMYLRSVMRSVEIFSREEHLMTVCPPLPSSIAFQRGNQRSLQLELLLLRGNSLLVCTHQRQY